MKYFLAIEIIQKPFIRWAGWANSIEELAELGEFQNPLIVAENLIPAYLFGVSPLKIVAGELVDRTVEEMATFETEYLVRVSVAAESTKIAQINASSFAYGGNQYPMHEAARLRYMAIENDNPADTNFMNIAGQIITIPAANLGLFFTQYYKQIQLITNLNIVP